MDSFPEIQSSNGGVCSPGVSDHGARSVLPRAQLGACRRWSHITEDEPQDQGSPVVPDGRRSRAREPLGWRPRDPAENSHIWVDIQERRCIWSRSCLEISAFLLLPAPRAGRTTSEGRSATSAADSERGLEDADEGTGGGETAHVAKGFSSRWPAGRYLPALGSALAAARRPGGRGVVAFGAGAAQSLAAGLPDGRAYELVSPAVKAAEVEHLVIIGGDQAAPKVNELAYVALSPVDGSNGPGIDDLATRGPNGWTTKDTLPPQAPVFTLSLAGYALYSSDLSKGLLDVSVTEPSGRPRARTSHSWTRALVRRCCSRRRRRRRRLPAG